MASSGGVVLRAINSRENKQAIDQQQWRNPRSEEDLKGKLRLLQLQLKA